MSEPLYYWMRGNSSLPHRFLDVGDGPFWSLENVYRPEAKNSEGLDFQPEKMRLMHKKSGGPILDFVNPSSPVLICKSGVYQDFCNNVEISTVSCCLTIDGLPYTAWGPMEEIDLFDRDNSKFKEFDNGQIYHVTKVKIVHPPLNGSLFFRTNTPALKIIAHRSIKEFYDARGYQGLFFKPAYESA